MLRERLLKHHVEFTTVVEIPQRFVKADLDTAVGSMYTSATPCARQHGGWHRLVATRYSLHSMFRAERGAHTKRLRCESVFLGLPTRWACAE